MNKPHVSMIQYRRGTLTGKPEGRRMAASLSSEEPVSRVFGEEVLLHTAGAVDMSRASNGLPLLLNHRADGLPIGRVEGIHIGNDMRLRGDLVFSEATEEARSAFALVEEGVLADVSIAYRVDEWQRGEAKDRIDITRWTPLEASLVSVPADGSVGIGRNLAPESEAIMPDENVTPEADTTSDIIETIQARSTAGHRAGAVAEGRRLNDIASLAQGLSRSLPDLAPDIEALADVAREDMSIGADRFRALALELVSGSPQPLAIEAPAIETRVATPRPGNTHRGLVLPGGDAKDRASRGMQLAILDRCGTELKPEDMDGNQYRGWSLLDIARECLELHGQNTRGLSSEQIARQAIGMRAISPGTANYETSDFPAVTENVVTKRVHDAYAAAPVTWNRWCSTTQVPDFKQFTIPRLSQISDLPVVAENAAYTDLTQVDAKEAATLVKRGGLMSFTWEAIVNDDQRMFARTAASMGESAARTVDKNVYGLLVLNKGVGVAGPVMGDTNQLFDGTNHANFGTNALELDGIVATRTAIARQTDDNSISLGIVMRYVIVPEELRDTADNLAGSEYLPWTEASPGAQRVNTIRSTFTVVPTIHLADATDWYGASAPGGTIEVAFLTGNQAPMIFRDTGWDTDALHFKVRHPSVAYPIDWRGMFWNEVA